MRKTAPLEKKQTVFRTNPITRRTFLSGLTATATATALSGGSTLRGAPLAKPASDGTMPSIRLTREGGDRATAYGMSAKIVARQGGLLLCSWLDVATRNQNHWALVDATRGEVVRRGIVGPPGRDNHCGVAMCAAPDGTTHCMIGAHGGSFRHYRMPADADRSAWDPVEGEIGEGGTYPSLVCDGEGTLHLTYRRSRPRPYHVMYSRKRKQDAAWSEPRPLVRAAVGVHTWTTNAMEVGPDGRLHVVLTNTQTVPDEAWYFGAAHICSDNSGDSWRQLGSEEPLVLPVGADTLRRIEGDEFLAERTLSAKDKQRLPGTGPSQYYYFNILLSNPVIDACGVPWVVVHNLLRGEAGLYHPNNDGAWNVAPLDDAVRTALPDHQIAHMGQLSRHEDGTLEIVLMVVPDNVASHRYGAIGTKLVRVLSDVSGMPHTCELVCEPNGEGIPDWQPNIQRPTWHGVMKRPALLWTRGVNSHTLTERHTNVNDVETEVWLQLAG